MLGAGEDRWPLAARPATASLDWRTALASPTLLSFHLLCPNTRPDRLAARGESRSLSA
jgi:hypothetical protein